jgi:pyruvate carboxylase
VFTDFANHQRKYSDTSVLPTPAFFHGLAAGEEVSVDIEPGKTLIIRYLTVGDPHPDGQRTVFFELNGQPREVLVADKALSAEVRMRPKADKDDPLQIGSPMPGLVVNVLATVGEHVAKGQKLCTLEAMKMETTVYAELAGRIAEVLVCPGTQVEGGDLLFRLAE